MPRVEAFASQEPESVQIRRNHRSTAIAATVTICLGMAACASGSDPSEAADAPPASQDQSGTIAPAAPSTAAEPPSGGGGGGQNGSNIDWATVDLTTIDWATLDLSTIDWRAIEDNPTGEKLSEDDRAIIQSRLFPGSATVTIGDESGEGQSFLCASGHENTESDVYSFSSYTESELGGMRVRVGFDVRDESGTGQTSGDATFELQIIDVRLQNPDISWAMTSAESVTIDGRNVSVSGLFDDLLTDDVVEAIPGSLNGECGDTSRM